MDFLNISDTNTLCSILGKVRSIQNSQDRRTLLNLCKVEEKHINMLPLENPTTSFVKNLISNLLEEYGNDLDPKVWGFINKKPVLIKFLEHLIEFGAEVQSDDAKEFIDRLVKKWRPWYESELNKYKQDLSEFYIKFYKNPSLQNSDQAQISKNIVWDKLLETQSQLKLGESEFNEIWSGVQKDEQEREDEKQKKEKERQRSKDQTTIKRASWILGLSIILLSIIYFPWINSFIGDAISGDPPPPTKTKTAETKTTQTKTTETKTKTTETKIDHIQGWMFIGKISRNSSGDDILDPLNIYPRMIPQRGAIVELRETTHIRFNQPQAPDFDYAQQEILGCVVPGEKVEILQVEIVPNRAVWARVQKTGGNPTFSPRCPSNGIRAWW